MEMIDVKKIMDEIREDIKKRGIEEELLFEEIIDDINPFENSDIEIYLEEVNRTWSISAYKELKSRSGLLGKIIIFFKKVIRKLIKFYIEPVVADQVEYNANSVRTLNAFWDYMQKSESRILELEKEIKILKKEQKKV